MTARFPLTLYSPSTDRPAEEEKVCVIMASRTLQEDQRHPQLVSTCSMHIFTKAGTVVDSLWHRTDRLQPNT